LEGANGRKKVDIDTLEAIAEGTTGRTVGDEGDFQLDVVCEEILTCFGVGIS